MVEEGVIMSFVPMVLFLSIAASIGLVMYFRTQRAKAEAASGVEYRKLAEEAVRGQTALLQEIQKMNTTLGEIERLLREV